MARTHARIALTIWQDEDFCALPAFAQWAYFLILSQPDLSQAGVLWYRPARWASRSSSTSVEDIERAVKHLEMARYVVVDRQTEELLVRTFIRNDGVWKTPNVFLSALRSIPGTLSRTLRGTLREELLKLPLNDLNGPKGPIARTEAAAVVAKLPILNPDGPGSGASSQVNGTPVTSGPSSPEQFAEPFAEQYGQGSGERGVVTEVSKGFPLPHSPIPLPPSADAFASPTRGLVVVPDEPAEVAEVPDEPSTAQTLIAEWIDLCPNRPPGRVIGHVAKHVGELLAEGIDHAHVRAGLIAWHSKALHPSTLPSVVNEVMNASSRRPPAGNPGGNANQDMLQRAMQRAQAKEASGL